MVIVLKQRRTIRITCCRFSRTKGSRTAEMSKSRCRFNSCDSRSGAPADLVSPSDLEELAWPNTNHRHVPLTFDIDRTA